ncbi:MAG: sigma-70 family RNA polymerase sigma factor [Pyrinomonadaceae bacterium]|nr:sigma-70 family RNA polymerase sigma factor [Phycisphaerales bacterium]
MIVTELDERQTAAVQVASRSRALVSHVNNLLADMRTGGTSSGAASQLFPLVYDELRRLAGAIMRREGAGHTLNPTSLVHEAFLRLTRQRTHGWNGRAEFISVAAQAMRRVLIDHARRKKAEKRTPGVIPTGDTPDHTGKGHRVELTDTLAVFEERAIDLVALDDALDALAQLDERKSRLVEMRFFGGLDMAEAAEVLGVPLRTAERDWAMARAWLRARITGGAS